MRCTSFRIDEQDVSRADAERYAAEESSRDTLSVRFLFSAGSVVDAVSRCHEALSRFCPEVRPDFTEMSTSVAYLVQVRLETIAAGAVRQSQSGSGD
jgi:hypothetical protein